MFEYTFLQNAVMAAMLVSITAGIVGSIIVANRLVFISGGIAHTAYGGVGLAYYLAWPPFLGALVFTVPAACLIAWMQNAYKEKSDTLIGLFWASGMAAGVIFLDLTPGYKSDLMSYLFGSILTVPGDELIAMAILNAFIIIIVAAYYRQIISISTDHEYAKSRTLPVVGIYTLILCLIATSVVIIMRSTGLILMIALLTVPSGIIRRWVSSLLTLMIGSIIMCAILCMGGLGIAYYLNISSGAAIILFSSFCYIINLVISEKVLNSNI